MWRRRQRRRRRHQTDRSIDRQLFFFYLPVAVFNGRNASVFIYYSRIHIHVSVCLCNWVLVCVCVSVRVMTIAFTLLLHRSFHSKPKLSCFFFFVHCLDSPLASAQNVSCTARVFCSLHFLQYGSLLLQHSKWECIKTFNTIVALQMIHLQMIHA